MTAYKSPQYEIIDGTDTSTYRLTPDQHYGRVRCSYFSDTPAGGGDATDSMLVARLPKGARVIDIQLVHGAHTGLTGLDVGLQGADGSGYIDAANSVADDPDFFTPTALDVSSAGRTSVLTLATGNFGYKTEKEVDVILDVAVGVNGFANAVMSGFILYVVD